MTAKPVYIITGATGGIGRALVTDIAAHGDAVIVMAVRNPRRALDMVKQLPAPGCEFHALALDLESFTSVDAFVADVKALGLKIDVLINNAGIMPGEITITADGYERATQVNYVATRRLTEQLLPLMADGGCIVFTTSVTRKLTRLRDDWKEHAASFRGIGRRFITYGRSKRMIAAYAAELTKQLAGRRIRVNCSDPGIVDTGIINMGNPVIDRLSAVLFRPLIYTPLKGAQGVLRAIRTDVNGCILTPRTTIANRITK